MNRRPISRLNNFTWSLALLAALLLSAQAASATTVRVITSLGDFSIELFDDVAPATVANFLNYVNSGRYNGTVIHRAVVTPTPFIVQGGWLTFDAGNSTLNPITTDDPIQNEFGTPNTRGTVAMAKVGGDPNSATSQWFVNLADNSANLDEQNGGFTVFGQVIGDGMAVVDAIASLPTFPLSNGELPDFPLINYSSGSAVSSANFVNIAMLVVQAPNYFDEASATLRVAVDAGAAGLASLAFSINATAPAVVIQLDLGSVEVLTETVENMATFDAATGTLILPELSIGGAVAFRNLQFKLSDSELLLFTLESFDPI